MAITVSGTALTFNDSSVQTRKPMKLIAEVINSSTQGHSFTALDSYTRLILVWDSTQISGPASTSLTITESTTTVAYSTRDPHSLILSSTSSNNVTQATQASGTTNFLSGFSTGANFTKGYVTLTRVRNMSISTTSLWNLDIKGGSSGGNYLTNLKVGTPTLSASNFGIGALTLTFGLCNGINIRLYGIE